MVSRVIPVERFDLVVFGATGDLARRKIMPGLYRRWLDGQIPEGARIIGAARSRLDPAGYAEFVREALAEFVTEAELADDRLAPFLSMLSYVAIDATGTDGWSELRAQMRDDTVRAV